VRTEAEHVVLGVGEVGLRDGVVGQVQHAGDRVAATDIGGTHVRRPHEQLRGVRPDTQGTRDDIRTLKSMSSPCSILLFHSVNHIPRHQDAHTTMQRCA